MYLSQVAAALGPRLLYRRLPLACERARRQGRVTAASSDAQPNKPLSIESLTRTNLRFDVAGCIERFEASYRQGIHLTTDLRHTSAGDKYASVRTGIVSPSIDEEAVIVRYLDEMATSIATASAVIPPAQWPTRACYGVRLRPVQIAKLTLRNMRAWKGAHDDRPALHWTFHMAKQKTALFAEMLSEHFAAVRKYAENPAY